MPTPTPLASTMQACESPSTFLPPASEPPLPLPLRPVQSPPPVFNPHPNITAPDLHEWFACHWWSCGYAHTAHQVLLDKVNTPHQQIGVTDSNSSSSSIRDSRDSNHSIRDSSNIRDSSSSSTNKVSFPDLQGQPIQDTNLYQV